MSETLADKKVLIAEDDWLVAEWLTGVVRSHGGSVIGPAATERKARSLISQSWVDVALLDVMLESGPCYALAEHLMNDDVRVLLTTGYRAADIPHRFSHLPILAKPFRLASLEEYISDFRKH